MGRIKYFLVLLLCVLSLSAYKKNEKITIFMIGDSTMANKDISGGKDGARMGNDAQKFLH